MKNHKKAAIVALVFVMTVIGWGLYLHQTTSSRQLSKIMPQGGLVYIEAKDFAGLMQDWNASPGKALWVKSDNNKIFSNSRLFLRLSKASDEFAAAAGLPPSMDFLKQITGKESAIAIYDIGQLEFLYVTRLSSGNFLQSPLWQSRNKFQSRSAAGKQFYSRNDQESGRVVAFAVAGDYLFLGTRDDLVAGALELYSGGKGRALAQEGWFVRPVAAAGTEAGDLRMVLNMGQVAVTPHFRTYWIQQNITEMQSYSTALCDLYRNGADYREERVLLPKKELEDDNALTQSAQAVTTLLPLVPKDYVFYQAKQSNSADILAVLEEKILSPHYGSAPVEKLAPEVKLTGGETGSGSDLETRIDIEQAQRVNNESAIAGLQKQLESANPLALLVIQATRKNKDQVLLTMPTVMVVESRTVWDIAALQKALQDSISPGLTASRLGVQWKQRDTAGGYYELDGLYPVEIALRDKLLFIANNADALSAALQTKSPMANQPVSYASGFSHTRSRQDFYDLTTMVDRGATAAIGNGQERIPQFFSENIGSFSRSFARLDSEEITTRAAKDKLRQTVIYHWAQ